MRYYMPTKVVCGEHCISENPRLFLNMGNRAFIVCGASSALASGALDDVLAVLKNGGAKYEVYDGVQNNPTVANAYEAGVRAREFKADYIIGIGGGSPLDAAKAAAVYASNDIEPMEIYEGFKNPPLKIAAIPTTAGTGSEVTPYAVLTVDDARPKVSVKGDSLFPQVAFLDRRYTKSLPKHVAVHTALDALSHGIESILCKNNSYASEFIAIESIKILSEEIKNTLISPVPGLARERLLYASMLAGVAISHTGTTIVHSMGYSLTYYKGLPHGLANGLLLAPFLRQAAKHVPHEAEKVFSAMKLGGADEFSSLISQLLPEKPGISDDEAEFFAGIAIKSRNVQANLWMVTKDDEKAMYLDI